MSVPPMYFSCHVNSSNAVTPCKFAYAKSEMSMTRNMEGCGFENAQVDLCRYKAYIDGTLREDSASPPEESDED